MTQLMILGGLKSTNITKYLGDTLSTDYITQHQNQKLNNFFNNEN